MILSSLPPFSKLKIIGLDIGCSGSKPMEWDRLENKLQYNGVDPLVNEIQKLRAKYPRDNYLTAFITDKGCKGKADELTSRFFSRTSAAADINSGYDLVKENFNSGLEVKFSDEHFTLNETLKKLEIKQLELLKIDVDGDDFAILKAFFNLPGNFAKNLLAFEIESQFHGDIGEYGNNFGNILQLANTNGFYLYKLDSYTYSRNDLRKPYVHNFPAQTHGGQVLWGDAFFARDAFELDDTEKLKKLALIFEAYELEDCSFEIITNNLRNFEISSDEYIDIKDQLTKTDNGSHIRNNDIQRLIKSKLRNLLRG